MSGYPVYQERCESTCDDACTTAHTYPLSPFSCGRLSEKNLSLRVSNNRWTAVAHAFPHQQQGSESKGDESKGARLRRRGRCDTTTEVRVFRRCCRIIKDTQPENTAAGKAHQRPRCHCCGEIKSQRSIAAAVECANEKVRCIDWFCELRASEGSEAREGDVHGS